MSADSSCRRLTNASGVQPTFLLHPRNVTPLDLYYIVQLSYPCRRQPMRGYQWHLQWRRNRRFRRFNEPGAPSSWGPPSPGPKNFSQKKNTPLGVGGLHSYPDPVAGPHALKPPPPLSAHRASSFSPWGLAEGIEGPQVTVEPGPLRALLCHWASA